MDRDAIEAILSHISSLIDAGRSSEALTRLRRLDTDEFDEEQRIEFLCLRALAIADLDQPESAMDQLRELVEENPDSGRAVGALGLVLSRLGQWDDAAEMLEQAIELDPEDPGNFANLGLVLERMGEFGSAKDAYEKSLKAGGDFGWVLPRLALVQAELGERAAAKETLRLHLAQSPKDIDQWITLAIMHSDDEEYEEAFLCYQNAEKVNPSSTMLRMNWGVTAVRAGRLDDARQQLAGLEKLEPMTSRPILLRAFLREAEGRESDSLRCYDEAVRVAEIGDAHEVAYALEMAMDYSSRHGMLDRSEKLFAAAYKENACTIDLCDAYREVTGRKIKKGSWFSVLVEADYRPGLDEVTEPDASESEIPKRYQRNIQLVALDRDDALNSVSKLLERMKEGNVRIVEFLGEEPIEDVFTGIYEIEPQSLVLNNV